MFGKVLCVQTSHSCRWASYLLWLVPGGRVGQLHDVGLPVKVLHQICFGVKILLAAVAAALVDLPPDEVHQLDLLIEPEV